MEQKLPFCTWPFTILPSFAAVLCHQTMSNPWGFSCMTPINFNQSQENKLLSKALWKCTPPFLTIILLCFVWWAIFRRQSLNAASFQYLLFVHNEISTVCSLLPTTVDNWFHYTSDQMIDFSISLHETDTNLSGIHQPCFTGWKHCLGIFGDVIL